jgi:hypothetical protein
MRERILAVVGAVVLIVAAVAVRSLLAGDDGPASGGGGGSAARPVVACTPDLRSVCEALVADGAITAAPGPLDLAGAAEPPAEVTGWITWDPAPGVVNFDRPDTWLAPGVPLASAPLGVLAASGPGQCPPTTTWAACVVAGADAGLAVGIGPGTTAQGLARLEPVARALVPAQGDFTTIPTASLRRVLDSPQIAQADLVTQLNTFLTRRGALNLVVGAVPALRTAAARQTTATVASPTPAATLTVVLATRTRAGTDPLPADLVLDSDRAATALEALGLAAGTGSAAPPARAGELYAVLDKIR